MKTRLRTFIVWLCLFGLFFALFWMRSKPLPERDLATFEADVERGAVTSVSVEKDNHLTVEILLPQQSSANRSGDNKPDAGKLVRGHYQVRGNLAANEALLDKLYENDVDVNWGGSPTNPWTELFFQLLPLIVLIFVFFFFMRRMGGGKNVLELRNSNARSVPLSARVTFAEVGGCEEAKVLLQDVINFLKDSTPWEKAGVRLPRGILLEGPPGCGKSLLGRALAGETSATFLYISASEFTELFIGVGAARVRDLFEKAKKQAPAVIFIDELDSVGRRRGSGVSHITNDEREQTLNQLLVCMDGFETHERVIVMAATNRPDILDRALLRTGRFDRIIRIPPLSESSRLEVLKIHTRGKNLGATTSLETLAEITVGKTGSELENICNEAGILAVRRAHLANGNGSAPALEQQDFLEALAQLEQRTAKFNSLDLVLIESSSQLSEPTGHTPVRLLLEDGAICEGEIVWADGNYVKLASKAQHENIKLIPKTRIKSIEHP